MRFEVLDNDLMYEYENYQGSQDYIMNLKMLRF